MNIEVLKKVAKGLNRLNCTWAIGGSIILNYYGLLDKPNDIDILVDPKYADKIKEFMNIIGKPLELPPKDPFRTEEFFGYLVEDTIVEFMGGFKVDLGGNKTYEFILDDNAITDNMTLDGVKINLTSLEDWFVAYSVMKDPKRRVPLIKEYFKKSKINHKNLLERNLNQDLPENIKLDIETILLLK